MHVFDTFIAARDGEIKLSLDELLELADHLGASGHTAAKNKVMSSIIPRHPAYGKDENAFARVYVHEADQARRAGDPAEALRMLRNITTERMKPLTIALYYQALGQCYLKQLPTWGIPAVAAALHVQRKIFNLDEYDVLPVDKRLYFLETMIAMKLRLSEFDDELADSLARYSELLYDMDDDESFKPRALAMYHYYRGQYWAGLRAFDAALDEFVQAVRCFPSSRNRAMAAMLGLAHGDQAGISSTEQRQLRTVFKRGHKELLQTDIDEFRQEYAEVCRMLKVEPLFK